MENALGVLKCMYGFPYSRQRHQRNFISLTYTEIVSSVAIEICSWIKRMPPMHFEAKIVPKYINRGEGGWTVSVNFARKLLTGYISQGRWGMSGLRELSLLIFFVETAGIGIVGYGAGVNSS